MLGMTVRPYFKNVHDQRDFVFGNMTRTTLWRRLSMKVFITNLQWSILLKTETGRRD